eukprot:CAMPEP_0184661332 /NCGR_PEP_ID=MMETSP0308-20130426/37956_1 /TAXON_ID=38269 /ORGANISM="Gloeochaete witrockiana, Strain SAG 46.84" /LENGTH=108 /DNA_ID=CAMNT_0027102561 /DNA_START=123 /DNA_END=446 /DNA_ORIENTATION=+
MDSRDYTSTTGPPGFFVSSSLDGTKTPEDGRPGSHLPLDNDYSSESESPSRSPDSEGKSPDSEGLDPESSMNPVVNLEDHVFNRSWVGLPQANPRVNVDSTRTHHNTS